jgi:acetyl esterase/lipase
MVYWPLLLVFVAATGVFAQTQSTGQAKAPSDEQRLQQFLALVNRPVVYSVPGMDRVRIQKDLVYVRDPGTERRLDVYLPQIRSEGKGYPVVFLIHGGVDPHIPVKPKEWGLYQSYGRLLAASGFATVIFNQSTGFPDPKLESAEADMLAAVSYIDQHATEFGLNPQRKAFVAFSAGGPLLTVPMRHLSPAVRCMVAMYAFLDVAGSKLHQQFLSPALLQTYSMTSYLGLQTHLPPMMVVRAGSDQVPYVKDSIDLFMNKAISSNTPLEFLNYPEAPHGFENQLDGAQSKRMVKELVDFLAFHLASDERP